MFFVNLYKDKNRIIHAPFVNKQAAIDYFNSRIDFLNSSSFIEFDSIEIMDDNTCLFDYEVK